MRVGIWLYSLQIWIHCLSFPQVFICDEADILLPHVRHVVRPAGVVYFVGFANNFDNTGGRNVHMSCHPADEDGLVL